MLEDEQVNRQGAQPRPDGQGRIRDARRPGRDMGPAAGALRLVQVVLHPLRRRRRQHRDLLRLRRDLFRLIPDQRITRIRRRHIGHKTRSSRETTLSHHANTAPGAET